MSKLNLAAPLLIAAPLAWLAGCGDDATVPNPIDGLTISTTLRSGTLRGDGAGGAPDATGGLSLGMAPDGTAVVALGADFVQEMGPGDTQIILASSTENVDTQRNAGAMVSPSIGTVPNGFSGPMVFALPAGVDIQAFSHAIIWCPTAGVNFGAAELSGGTPAPTPTVVRMAALSGDGAGGAPDATGTVEILRTGTTLSVRLGADFMQEMGPGDTQLILARTNENVQMQRDADAAAASPSLGTIPNGGSGTFSFDLPAGVDLDAFDHAIVWCPTAGVNFGTAELPKRTGALAADGAGGAPDATGAVTFGRNATGQLTVELGADFMQEMGPGDTQLILARSTEEVGAQRSADANSTSSSLGTVTNGASGAMSFVVPDGVDVDLFDHLIVWCPTAGVNFGAAPLQ